MPHLIRRCPCKQHLQLIPPPRGYHSSTTRTDMDTSMWRELVCSVKVGRKSLGPRPRRYLPPPRPEQRPRRLLPGSTRSRYFTGTGTIGTTVCHYSCCCASSLDNRCRYRKQFYGQSRQSRHLSLAALCSNAIKKNRASAHC